MASRGRRRRGRPRGTGQAPPVLTNRPLLRLLGLQFLPLHRLVQLVVKEVRVTSKDSSHIILQRYRGGGGGGGGSDGGRPLVPVD